MASTNTSTGMGGLRRRVYTTPKALQTVTAKNRPATHITHPVTAARNRTGQIGTQIGASSVGESALRARPVTQAASVRGDRNRTGQIGTQIGASSVGESALGPQTGPLGEGKARPVWGLDALPAAAYRLGTGGPPFGGSATTIDVGEQDYGTAYNPEPTPRGGPWRGGEQATSRAGWQRGEGFDPIGQHGWKSWGGDVTGEGISNAVPFRPLLTEAMVPQTVNKYSSADNVRGVPYEAVQAMPISRLADMGTGFAQARTLADQGLAIKESEAGRSYLRSPLSQGEEGRVPADPVYGRELEPLPEGEEEEGEAPTNEEDYRRLFAEKSGITDDYIGYTAAAVAAGHLTWDEAYRMLNDHGYTITENGELVVARGHLDPGGLAGMSAQNAREALFGPSTDQPAMLTQEKRRGTAYRARLENFFSDIGTGGGDREHFRREIYEGAEAGHADLDEQWRTLSQHGYYLDGDGNQVQVIPESGEEGLGAHKEAHPEDFSPTPVDRPPGTGEYGQVAGSWEEEFYKALYENPVPIYSEEDIASQRQGVQDTYAGVYQDALRTAGYQNLMMGGSPEMMMGAQADMMRKVGTTSAQHELETERQMRDKNFQAQMTDVTQKRAALMQVALGHQGEELGAVAFARAKEMADYQSKLQRDYVQWYDENIEPSWFEHLIGATGEGVGKAATAYGVGWAKKAGAAAI